MILVYSDMVTIVLDLTYVRLKFVMETINYMYNKDLLFSELKFP